MSMALNEAALRSKTAATAALAVSLGAFVVVPSVARAQVPPMRGQPGRPGMPTPPRGGPQGPPRQPGGGGQAPGKDGKDGKKQPGPDLPPVPQPAPSQRPPSEDQEEPEEPAPQKPGDKPAAPGADQGGPPGTGAGPSIPRTVCHGRTIRRIEVKGARRVSPGDVRANIDLREGRSCSDPAVAQAIRTLWDLGFFDDLVVEGTAVGEDKVDLLIRVKERPAIGSIVYEGNDALGRKKIAEEVSLREGAILSRTAVQAQVSDIEDLYAKEGYFLAQVDYDIEPLPDAKNEVEVQFTIDEGRQVTVRRVRFVGNDNLSGDTLQGIMKTRETGLFSFLTSSDTFDRDAFDEDITRLQAYYYDQGYLQMRITNPRIQLTPDRRYIDVTIPIEEGPRFKIGKIDIGEVNAQGEDVEPLRGRDWLRDQIELGKGDWFSRSTLARNIQSIRKAYRNRGYAKVKVVPKTDLDAKKRIVDLKLQIRRGPLVHIERINIRGNTKTRDRVIRREIMIAEGERYDRSLINRSRRRVQALGYFERVDVSETEGSRPDLMVLNYEITERATGTFQVGAGFSSIESFILTARIRQQNLFGRGQSISLQLQLSGIRQTIQASFTEPYLFGSHWRGSVRGFKTIRQFRDFTRDSTGGGFTLGHPIFDDRFRFFFGYTLEKVDIDARTGGLFGRGAGAGFNIKRQLPVRNLFLDGLNSSIRFGLRWDSRNNRLFPTSGIYAQASTEVSDTFLGSDNVYIRNEGFFRFYQRIWGPFVLKTNTEVGLITSRRDRGVPLFERYFLGGIFDVRGFRLNGLGPRAGLPRSFDPTADVPREGVILGGNFKLQYNIEIEFPIVEAVGIRGVVFTDGGNIWNLEDSLCQAPRPAIDDPASNPCGLKPFRLRHSWGFGIRWISPLGPLRFEWGLPFNPRSHETPIRFDFTVGNFF